MAIRPDRDPPRYIIDDVIVSASVLFCPACRSGYLHQGRVVIYDRDQDAETTLVTSVYDGAVSSHYFPSDEVRNPSSRRQGLTIDFDCEDCAFKPRLRIAQHKGSTLLSWSCEDQFGELRARHGELRPEFQPVVAAAPPPPYLPPVKPETEGGHNGEERTV